ncbi:MAG: DUF2127 domain-containing protein [Nitrospira sp. CR1.1]|jgi:uncharacterized membrane protein (DUF2068 family)|nr:DUF2127 domain-containing protein [Nitrospira sp. CR1.1]
MPVSAPMSHRTSLAPIALFKLLKGLLVLLAGTGFLRWIDPEIETGLSPVLEALHLSIHTRLLHALALTVDSLPRHSVLLVSLVSFGYAALLFIEGFGLWSETSWAAYLTVISTCVLLPGEFHAVVRVWSMSGMAVLAVNIAIVGYLVRRLAEETLR